MGDWTLYDETGPVRSNLTREDVEGWDEMVHHPGLLEMNAHNPQVYALGPDGARLPAD